VGGDGQLDAGCPGGPQAAGGPGSGSSCTVEQTQVALVGRQVAAAAARRNGRGAALSLHAAN